MGVAALGVDPSQQGSQVLLTPQLSFHEDSCQHSVVPGERGTFSWSRPTTKREHTEAAPVSGESSDNHVSHLQESRTALYIWLPRFSSQRAFTPVSE